MATSQPSAKSSAARATAEAQRTALVQRLEEEGEDDLAERLQACSEKFRLHCTSCGAVKEVEKGCRQKWCPVCVRRIAAMRSEKYRLAVGMMQWPLFLTLTIPPTDEHELGDLKRLRQAFGLLRNKRLWKSKVRGGVAGLEISSRSGRFHPHLHTVVDCEWLAIFVPKPQRGDSKSRIAAKCLAASQELGMEWARCLKVTSLNSSWSGTIYKVKRASGEGITSEVLKYSVKGADLLECQEPVGPIIRTLQATRLVTSFGSLFGKARIDDEREKKPRPCPCCGKSEWMPEITMDVTMRHVREQH